MSEDKVRRTLSRGQFEGLAHNLNNPHPEYGSGFSVKAAVDSDSKADQVGQRAKDSYMVGGLTSAPEGFYDRPVSASEISGYTSEHQKLLEPDNRYLGGWGPSNMGDNATLDVSTAIPKSDMGMVAAVIAATAAGEDAVGIVDAEGDYEGDIDTTRGMAMSHPDMPRTPANQARQKQRKEAEARWKQGQ